MAPQQDAPLSDQRDLAAEDGDVQEVAHGLSEKEQHEIQEAQRPRAPVVYEIVRLEGERELRRPASSLWWSGVAAGISIGFSFLAQAALAAGLPQTEWGHAVASLGYSVGFIIVILGRQQLFTENVLTAVLPVITRWRLAWLLRMLRLWGVVLAANVVGCLLFACAFAYLPMMSAPVAGEMARLVGDLMTNSPWEMFAKGIGAGWLIAAVVWIVASISSGEFLVIALLTSLIAIFRFTHIVAGSAEALYGWAAGLITFYDASVRFFLPTLAGNVFGGTVLFSVLSYGQVREEIFEEQELRRRR